MTDAAKTVDYEQLLLDNLELVERTVGSIVHRYAVSSWDADDFCGQVKLRLVADDYAVLRQFAGRSRLSTYLTTVVMNLFRDFLIQRWGKWRPSAAAKRMGEIGVQLEALLYRDGFSSSEAFELMRNRFGVRVADEELEEIAIGLRPRNNRRFESDAVLARLQSAERSDSGVLAAECGEAFERAETALQQVVCGLDAEERLILRMRFADGLTVRAIAEALDLEPRRMYARLRRLLTRVRQRVEKQGVSCEEVLDLLDWPACDFEAVLSEAAA